MPLLLQYCNTVEHESFYVDTLYCTCSRGGVKYEQATYNNK